MVFSVVTLSFTKIQIFIYRSFTFFQYGFLPLQSSFWSFRIQQSTRHSGRKYNVPSMFMTARYCQDWDYQPMSNFALSEKDSLASTLLLPTFTSSSRMKIISCHNSTNEWMFKFLSISLLKSGLIFWSLTDWSFWSLVAVGPLPLVQILEACLSII